MYLPAARRGPSGYANAPARTTASCSIGGVSLRKVVAPRFVVDSAVPYVDPGDAFVIAFVSSGQVQTDFGRASSELTAGRMAMNDMSHVSGFHITPDFRSMSIRIDRSLLDISATESDRLSHALVPYDDGTPLIMCAMATQVLRMKNPLERSSAEAVARSLVDLATAFANESLGRFTTPEVARRNVVLEASAFIDAHLPDSSLTPATIADALHISLRSLHLAFEHESASVARTILGRRLDRCKDALENPAHRRLSIEAIAARWGFSNASHFSRAFRASFGSSPREWRVQNALTFSAR